MPEQGSWSDLILPFAVGASSLGTGFAAGRNPAADNPGAIFLQAPQLMSLMDYRQGLTQHYGDLSRHQQQQDVQQQQNRAMEAAKQAAEYGNVETIDTMKDALGPYYTGMRQQALYMRQLAGSQGLSLPGGAAAGNQELGLPPVRPLTPGQPAMPTPQAPPSMGGEQPTTGYRPQTTRTFTMGKMSQSQQTPATTDPQAMTEFMGRYQTLPIPNQFYAELNQENIRRQKAGYPTIPMTKETQDLYERRLFWERPEVYKRMKLTEQAAQVPPEVAAISLEQQGQPAPVNPFDVQAGRERSRAVQKETEVGTARQQVERKFARLPEGERTKLQEMDDVLMNAAAVMDLKNSIVKRYGNRPGILNAPIERLNETLGKQDPEMTRFLDLYGKLYNAARKRIAGTAVSAGEKQALETYLKDPRGNVVTVFRGIEDIFRTTMAEEKRSLATAQTYGGEDISPYAYHKILERSGKGGPLYPELSTEALTKRAPKLRYNPATRAIEPVPEG